MNEQKEISYRLMNSKFKHTIIILFVACIHCVIGQDTSISENTAPSYEMAYQLVNEGKNAMANLMLTNLTKERPNDQDVKSLLARTYSWKGDYDKARSNFNETLSVNKYDRELWISAVKNELYAKNYSTALGLSNKALLYIQDDEELERLKSSALSGIKTFVYSKDAWFNINSKVTSTIDKSSSKKTSNKNRGKDSTAIVDKAPRTSAATIEGEKNRMAFNSSFTVFDQTYDPMIFSSISMKRETPYGSIIPTLNFSNRLGINGLQYNLDLYPKLTKGLYAYLNYAYSNSEIYPKHRAGGDIYVNLKSGLEFSGGGRFINFATRDVKVITNSIGYYLGNYYFSLRSYVTPVPDQVTRASGNLLLRKYFKDAENYLGLNFGYGFSPELRQFTSGDQLLEETLLYIESQRFSCEYQFTSKNNLNSYLTNIGVMRQELIFAPGSYFWSFSAGLTYQVKF